MNLRRAFSLQLNSKWVNTLRTLPDPETNHWSLSIELTSGNLLEGVAFNYGILKTDKQISNEDISSIKIA